MLVTYQVAYRLLWIFNKMVTSNYSKQTKITPNFKSRYQKRGGSHLSASHGKKFSQRLFKFETREMGIFFAFFHLTKNFLPGTKTREAQRFWERVNFSKEKLFSVLGNFSHCSHYSEQLRNSERVIRYLCCVC
jgi:hypothetical protein